MKGLDFDTLELLTCHIVYTLKLLNRILTVYASMQCLEPSTPGFLFVSSEKQAVVGLTFGVERCCCHMPLVEEDVGISCHHLVSSNRLDHGIVKLVPFAIFHLAEGCVMASSLAIAMVVDNPTKVIH